MAATMSVLNGVRADLVAHLDSLDAVDKVELGWAEEAAPGTLQLKFDWIPERVFSTQQGSRTYGFGARYFCEYPNAEAADIVLAAFVEELTDHFARRENRRRPDDSLWEVAFVNRGGLPQVVGGERKNYRKDFYINVTVRVPR